MEKEKNKSLIDRIWDFLASVKLAVIVFAVLSLTSIIGTIIEQNAEPEKNLKLLTKLFGAGSAPTLYNVFDSLGFMDMYHSWWFVSILLIFAANLIICSIDRLPKIMKVVKEPVKPLTAEQFKGFGIKKELTLKGNAERARESVTEAVRRAAGFKLAEVKEGTGFQLFSEKGNFTRLGVYITHFSILVIFLGALIGIFFGFKGFLNIPEGATYSVAFSRSGTSNRAEDEERERILHTLESSSFNLPAAAGQLGLDEAGLRAKMKRFGIFPLGFAIRCDDFNVDYYGATDMPKAYRSWLTVLQGGKPVLSKSIEVNDPLTYEGVTFYQSSYGMMPKGGGSSVFTFRVTSKEGKTERLGLKFGESFTIPGTALSGKIEDFSPALGFEPQTGRPFTYAQQMNNPAVLLSFSEGGKPKFNGWVLKRYPETWRLPDGHTVEFVDLWGGQYTGLQVRKDPGVWVVYLGCITMAAGLFIAFFMSHKKIWVRLVEEKNATRVIVAASANKNRHALERKIDRIVEFLSREKEGGK